MKKLIYICLLLPFVFQSCKKAYSPGDNYPIVNVLPPYAALKSTADIDVAEGDTASVPFVIRTALQQPVTITYSIAGAIALTNQTVTIAREAASATVLIPIPVGVIVAPDTTATATVTLLKAMAADGTVFRIGANSVASGQKVTLNITPPAAP